MFFKLNFIVVVLHTSEMGVLRLSTFIGPNEYFVILLIVKRLEIFSLDIFICYQSQGLRTVVFHMDRNFDVDEGKQDWKNENNKILDIFTGHFHFFT